MIFGGLLVAAVLSPGQNTISLTPHYRTGQVQRYRVDLTLTGSQAMSMQMVLAQKVAKMYPNGDAEIEITTEAGTMNMGGRSQPFPKTPAQTMRVNKFGQPVNGSGAGMIGSMGLDPSSMASMMPHRPLHAGEVVPIHQVGKAGASVNGTIKVVSIKNSVATLLIN
jgi:hypothetical protein